VGSGLGLGMHNRGKDCVSAFDACAPTDRVLIGGKDTRRVTCRPSVVYYFEASCYSIAQSYECVCQWQWGDGARGQRHDRQFFSLVQVATLAVTAGNV
jgi:hypothetical protein